MLIDTHCHFDFPPFSVDIKDEIKQYQQAGIDKIIIPAVSADNFVRIIELANTYPSIYYALGLHPIYQHQPQDLNTLNRSIESHHHKLVAIGEMGLDSYIDGADIEQQIYFLSVQLDLAKQHHLPVILHSRRTHALLYQHLKRAKLTDSGVIHGFSGSYEEAMQFIRLGFFIGVGGVISYEHAKKTRSAISKIPLEFVVFETDAPDMPLCGQQGRANHPKNIQLIANYFAQLRGEPIKTLIEQVTLNTFRLFPKLALNEKLH